MYKIESKCLIINNKKRGPETFSVLERDTTYEGSEKMGKCGKTGFYFTCDFIAFSNVNENDVYLALMGVLFFYINYSNIFHSSTAF